MTTQLSARCRTVRTLGSAFIAGLVILAPVCWLAGNANNQAWAQSADAELVPITVTATRSPIAAFEFPGMVSVTTQGDLEERQASSLDDVLDTIPGVKFTGGPRRTGETPSVRGVDSANVVILLDGVRQNFGSVHDGRLFIDPSLLRGVEVLRGAHSSLYGSGGGGGVIEFRTLRARDLLAPGQTAGTRISAGNQAVNDEQRVTVSGYTRVAPDREILGLVSYRRSGNIRLGNDFELPSQDDILTGLLTGSFAIADGHETELSVQRFVNEAREPDNGQCAEESDVQQDFVVDSAGRPSSFLCNFAGVQFGEVEKTSTNATWRISHRYSSEHWDIDATIYHNTAEVEERRLEAVLRQPEGALLSRKIKTSGFRAENRSEHDGSSSHSARFVYGLEGYRTEQAGFSSADRFDLSHDNQRDGVPDARAEFGAAFAQMELSVESLGSVPGRLLLIPGVRYDAFSTRALSGPSDRESDSALSRKLGISYFPTHSYLLFASVNEGFRAPTFDERFAYGVHFWTPEFTDGPRPTGNFVPNRFQPNPSLAPQESSTFEAGVGFRRSDVLGSGDHLEIKATAYRTEATNFIDQRVTVFPKFVRLIPPGGYSEAPPVPVTIPVANGGVTEFYNVPRAELRGQEIELIYENRRVRLKASYSTVDGEDSSGSGRKLGVLTPALLDVDLAWKAHEWGALLGAQLHSAERFDKVSDPNDVRPAYTVFDLYLNWEPHSICECLQGLNLSTGIDNVTDAEYERVYSGALEPGRNFRFDIAMTYNW